MSILSVAFPHNSSFCLNAVSTIVDSCDRSLYLSSGKDPIEEQISAFPLAIMSKLISISAFFFSFDPICPNSSSIILATLDLLAHSSSAISLVDKSGLASFAVAILTLVSLSVLLPLIVLVLHITCYCIHLLHVFNSYCIGSVFKYF